MAGHPDGSLQDGAHRMKSNMVRVFLSSTFTDMSSERRALLEKAYPEVLSFCRSLGLLFEVVDLRWGMKNVTFGDHEVPEICLQELQMCQRTSAGPAFTGLLGNRYGHRALPRLIEEKQFEVLLSKLSKNPEGVGLLRQWYLKDANAIPPTYVLQPITAHFPHYCDLRPASSPQRDNHVLSWRFTEGRLLELLRSAAAAAEAAGDITARQKQAFFTSGTEQELQLGLWQDDGERSALLFMRETPRQRFKGGAKGLSRFADVTADGLLDAEARALLAALKGRLTALPAPHSLQLHGVELSRGAVDPKLREHARYLDSVCQQFVAHMKAQVSAAAEAAGRGKPWGSTEGPGAGSEWEGEEERLHAISQGLPRRDPLLARICLAMWESAGARHGPLVLHGAAGMGKTALLGQVVQEMRRVLEARAAVVVRLLAARHPRRPGLDGVLRGVCLQACRACGVAPPPGLGAGAPVELLFRSVLEQVSQQGRTLLVVLDAVEQLDARHHSLGWLPAAIPPGVHLLVAVDTSSEAFARARRRADARLFELPPLACEEGRRIMEAQLRARRRSLSGQQQHAVLQSFTPAGCPLQLRTALALAGRWASFTPQSELRLGASTQEVMSQLLLWLEERHGRGLVGGALGYIALAREGLLEAELRDVMSLDDDVIREVYAHALPPTPSLIRLPPLLWARLRQDLQDQLEDRWTHGVCALAFSSRSLSEAVTARYLTSERRRRGHGVLAEYFLGRWAGRLKPAALPELSLLLADRKVPPQPLWFAPGLANVRKVQELPYHLLHAGLWEELRQEVIGCADWLFCAIRVCGVSRLIEDLDQCSHHMDCPETGLVRDALVLMRPSLDSLDGHMDGSLFYSELLARLSPLSPAFPALIGQLCSQCDEWFQTCPEPVLIPKSGFLQQPGGPLKHTLSGLHGGVLCVYSSPALGLLVAGSDQGEVVVWSLEDQQLLHSLQGNTAAVLCVRGMDSPAHCLSLAADGCLRKWSLTNGQQLLCIQEAVPVDSAPSSVSLHLSEQLLFVHTRTQVKVWRSDGEELHPRGTDRVLLVLGVLGESVVSLSEPGQVRISDPVNGSESVEAWLEDSVGGVTPTNWVTLPKGGTVVVVSAEGFLYQISRTGKHSAAEFPLRPSLLSASEDENILIAGCERTLSLFHLSSHSVDGFLDLHHDDSVLSACVSSDGRQVASGAADQLVRIWSVTTGALLDSLCGSDAPVTSVLFLGGLVASASAAAACVRLWSLSYDPQHRPAAHIPAGSAHAALTTDGDRVFYVRHQSQREVVCWSGLTGSPSERLPVSAEVSCLELAHSKRLLLCGLTSGTVLIYPLDHPQETLCIPPPESLSAVLRLALSPPEQHLLVAYRDSLSLFEVSTRDGFPTVEGPLQRLRLPPAVAPPTAVALLPGRRLLYGTGCGAVRLHDFSSGGGSELLPHRSAVSCVTASNWGGHALVGSEDGVQRLWALSPLLLDHTMEYKGVSFQGVLCAAFSESDRFVFTGSRDKTVKVWDVASGQLLYVQDVYSPVVRMVTLRNGFVALSQQGLVIREAFRCPDHISPDYSPLKGSRAQYQVTSRERGQDPEQSSPSELKDFNPAQINLNLSSMLGARPSSACTVL
ncbi:NACHT domain- and WD repeat-containing protein 1 [Menidia menidia]